jgi:hypothetical protein
VGCLFSAHRYFEWAPGEFQTGFVFKDQGCIAVSVESSAHGAPSDSHYDSFGSVRTCLRQAKRGRQAPRPTHETCKNRSVLGRASSPVCVRTRTGRPNEPLSQELQPIMRIAGRGQGRLSSASRKNRYKKRIFTRRNQRGKAATKKEIPRRGAKTAERQSNLYRLETLCALSVFAGDKKP